MTQVAATLISEDTGDPAIIDVWSRTASKYRVRAIVLLAVNLVLFAGLGCFAYWLRTGSMLAWSEPGYWRVFVNTFMPAGEATLSNFVLFPIRVDVIPMHGVVVGLMMAALVSIPILIAILYRFPAALPFVMVVAFLAVMPWLAINLLGACVLASVKPFRFRFRYASALLGLVLVTLYFYGASRTATPPVELVKPEARIKFMAPWVFATLASCVIMGGVLLLARIVNYRPGVVAPLLIIAFAVPVVLFERHVGRDELYYRLLENNFQVSFVDKELGFWYEQLVFEAFEEMPPPKPAFAMFRRQADHEARVQREAASRLRSKYAQARQSIIDRCRWFIRQFPHSRYAPNVLYIMGTARDMRVDLSEFGTTRRVRFYSDFPTSRHSASLNWRRVVANAPDSSISAAGRYKLAILSVRDRRLDDAMGYLDDLLATHNVPPPVAKPTSPAGVVKKVLTSAPADRSLKISTDQIVFAAMQLRALLEDNGRDARYGMRPMSGPVAGEKGPPGWFELDARDPHYAVNLQRILTAYPDCELADNIVLEEALMESDRVQRIDRLRDCIARFPDGDALPQALFRLGSALHDESTVAAAREAWQMAVQVDGDGLWGPRAAERLRSLPAAAEETE